MGDPIHSDLDLRTQGYQIPQAGEPRDVSGQSAAKKLCAKLDDFRASTQAAKTQYRGKSK